MEEGTRERASLYFSTAWRWSEWGRVVVGGSE
jgi:hypothetical protein